MKKSIFSFVLALAGMTVFAGDPTITADVSKPDGLYKKGEKIEFSLKVDADKLPVPLNLEITEDGKSVVRETVSTQEDGTLKYVYAPKTAGNVRLRAKITDADGKDLPAAHIGVMYDAETIRAGRLQEPEDFDAFWAQAKKELKAVPLHAEIKDLSEDFTKKNANYAKYDIWDVKIDCAGARPVSGVLTKPKNAKAKSLNAVVFLYSAAVCGANERIYNNCIVFEVNAHGIENFCHPAYYQHLGNTHLADYPQIGRESPRTYYFYGMYLRVLRALEYVKSLPEWNGKFLAAIGGSQGGAQAIFAGAMDPQVSFVLADVPAHCDYCAQLNDRLPGWPYIVKYDQDHKLRPECVREFNTAGYYDSVFFARRMKASVVFFSANLLDGAVPPAGVFAAYNELPKKTKKHMHTNPKIDHWPPDRDGEEFMLKLMEK